ncbi:MAG: polysaccharide deacetylase family protein [Candidatus Pacearchaeota archaeon]|jgi:peptidoglycan/xylan/chitin deacetylase (PgdA/CDA1 family)
MKNKLIITIDVEKDIHSEDYLGVSEGLAKFEKLADKHKIKPILFVNADCIIKYPEIFRKLHKKGWEISLHGYSHRRFDDLPFAEKEKEIKSSLEVFEKYLHFKPKGFRAPQHSIDNQTLDLLEKYHFNYDSSYTPFNLLQLFFFPKRFKLWFKQFFSKPNPYFIRKNLEEIPVSSLLIPPVSLIVRVFPKPILKIYFFILQRIFKKPVFYAHSWDFIEIKESRIDRNFSHTKFLEGLDYIMSISK